MSGDNDALRHELDEALALVQDQMQDLSTMQRKHSQLTAKGSAADGAVEVSIDAQRMVTGVVIDESYLEDLEFTDLGEHVKTAARAAVEEMGRLSAALLAPLTERREQILTQSGLLGEVPDFRSMLGGFESMVGEMDPSGSIRDGKDD